MAPKRKLPEVEKELEDVKQDLEETKKALEAKEETLTKSEAEKKKAQTDSQAKIKTLETNLKKLTDEKERANKDGTESKKLLTGEKEKLKKQEEKAREELKERSEQIEKLNREKRALEAEREDLERKQRELEGTIKTKDGIIAEKTNDQQSAKFFLDVSIDACQFAKPFPYFITVQLGDDFEPRRTDTSYATQYPAFQCCSFLLPFNEGRPTENQLILRSYIVVNPNDPSSSTKKLGEAIISLDELTEDSGLQSIEDDYTRELRQRTIVKNVSFRRKRGGDFNASGGMIASSSTGQLLPGQVEVSIGRDGSVSPTKQGDSGENAHVLVGKCLVRIEKKYMKPSESSTWKPRYGVTAPGALGDAPGSSISGPNEKLSKKDASQVAGLDQSLWLIQPFQHRLRILLHCVKDLVYVSEKTPGAGPVTSAMKGFFQQGGSSGSTSDPTRPRLVVTARTLRHDGSTSFEIFSGDVPLPMEQFGSTVANVLDYLNLNQEIVVPLRLPNADSLRDQRCQLTLEIHEDRSIKEVLSVVFFLNVIPAFDSVTVLACAKNTEWALGQGFVLASEPASTNLNDNPELVKLFSSNPNTNDPLDAEQTGKRHHRAYKPAFCFSLTREIELSDIAESYHGMEWRLHGIPPTRPLPESVNNPVLVISPDFPVNSAEMPAPRIPILK